MFGLYLCHYLLDKNKISQSQFDSLVQQLHQTKAKLGLIAVSEKLLTAKQAEEINEIQKKTDRRFGDIAIDKGYLVAEEVTHLLNLQGNSYLSFIQLATEQGILTRQEIEACLEEYQQENNYSNSDVEALKSGDIDRIIDVFVDSGIPFTGECAALAIRNIIRFINSELLLKKAYTAKEYSFSGLACQQMTGDHSVFVGLAGSDKALLEIARPFAKEDFTAMDEDAFDSVCEFINCTNGLYASKLSQEEIQIDMTPPGYYRNGTLTAEGGLFLVPIMIRGEQVELAVITDHTVSIT
ncbi:chemotaxis protein CheX [Anaerotaenia torta]|uniref:chemotaxis protein CheX n=1 Tax=Anaerotaenia torta TaxID=433293 RepID=UPI003D2265DB